MEIRPIEKDENFRDLPIESIKRICACLTVPNMVRTCLTLPGWDYVLDLPYIEISIAEHLSKFGRCDSGMRQLISGAYISNGFIDGSRAVRPAPFKESSLRSGLTSSNDVPLHVFRHFPIPIKEMFSDPNLKKFIRACETIFEQYSPRVHINNADHDDCDIVVLPVFVHFSEREDARFQISLVKQHQILLVLLLSYPSEDKISLLKTLKPFYLRHWAYLQGVATWRIWHVEIRDDKFVNLQDALKWACGSALERKHASNPIISHPLNVIPKYKS